MDAGRLAATGSNRQPWDFVVVTDRKMIAQFKPAGPWMEKAGAVIAVVMDPVSRWWVESGAATDREYAVREHCAGLWRVLGGR